VTQRQRLVAIASGLAGKLQNHPHLVQGIGRDGDLAPIEQFVCHVYGKLSLEMLPPTRDALELHTACTRQLSSKDLAAGRPGV